MPLVCSIKVLFLLLKNHLETYFNANYTTKLLQNSFQNWTVDILAKPALKRKTLFLCFLKSNNLYYSDKITFLIQNNLNRHAIRIVSDVIIVTDVSKLCFLQKPRSTISVQQIDGRVRKYNRLPWGELIVLLVKILCKL